MIRSISFVAAALLACLACIAVAPAASARAAPQAPPVYQQLKSFSGFGQADNPADTLIQGTDGALYGTAWAGGSNGLGSVFKVNTDGSGFTVLQNFDGSASGANPNAGLMQASDGTLYGTAVYGGSYNFGTVFKLNTDGSGFTVLLNFDGSTIGGNPWGGVIQGTDGALYGTASVGGSYNDGTVFKLNTDGTGFTVLLDLDGSTTGASPTAGLIQGTNGELYGTASSGGSSGYGTVFTLNTDGSGFTVLLNLDGSTTGANPFAGLMQGTDGKLYGTAANGGVYNSGTVFKLKTDGTGFSVLYQFDGSFNGWHPNGLMEGKDGALYGMALGGGTYIYGIVFKLKKNGTFFTVLQDFDGLYTGGFPQAGLMQGTDGELYGNTNEGGIGYGTLFKLKTDGRKFTVLLNFGTSATGASPCGLLQRTLLDDTLCGTASGGGMHNYGTLFKLKTDGTGFNVLQDFDYSTLGGNPNGVTQGRYGALYGTASSGGKYGGGTVFAQYQDVFTVLEALDFYSTGGGPCGLIQGTDYALYGAANSGGSYYCGTLFKLSTNGSGFTVLLNFDYSTNGANPNRLMQGTDGKLYGTASGGGSNGWGTAFRLNTDGTGFSVLQTFDGSTGIPLGALLQGTDGALYGTTSYGGSLGFGTVFTLKTDGTGFTVLLNCDGSTTGANPTAGLIQGMDGALYSTTGGGGNDGVGTVFQLLFNCSASWSNYGIGFPGTSGVPSFTSQAAPVLGTKLTLDLGNSYGASTVGLLFVGFQRTQIHSGWGGDLLMIPVLTLSVGLPPGGASLTGDIPPDPSLCGFTIDLQAIESDPGAAKGVSFSPGLELVLGH